MRYTKVGSTSYLVALVLVGVAAAFATWRMREERLPVDRGAGLRSAGRETYAAECASCHPDPIAFSGAGGNWQPLAELLLTGEAQVTGRAETRMVTRHPTFEDDSDERLAALLDYVTHAQEAAGPSSRVTAPTAASVRKIRSSLRRPRGPK